MRRFVLMVAPSANRQVPIAKLKNAFTAPGVHWWYYFENAWLIADLNDKHDTPFWREQVFASAPGLQCIIMEVDPRQMSGRLPRKAQRWFDRVGWFEQQMFAEDEDQDEQDDDST